MRMIVSRHWTFCSTGDHWLRWINMTLCTRLKYVDCQEKERVAAIVA